MNEIRKLCTIEIYTLKIKMLKITQLEKVRFFQVNELKLPQVELFSIFHFKSVVANESKQFCMAK